MVNGLNNTSQPWQSIIPQQMPWMSSYGPDSLTTQFGQPSVVGVANQPVYGLGQNGQTEQNIVHDQHLSMVNFPTATTITSPVTVCPTSSNTNCQYGTITSMPSNCVTTTTHSYPLVQNLAQISPPSIPGNPNFIYQSSSGGTQAAGIYNPSNSLTQLAQSSDVPIEKASNHKRSSVELEDDFIRAYEPPTKQLLSERRLFKKFGSLQIDGVAESNRGCPGEENSDDSEEDSSEERQDFNRYVYLLFKDKKNSGESFAPGCSGLERLAREERDKLSKAVVLWNPPVKNFLSDPVGEDESEDEEFKYTDHKDFLKHRNTSGDQSIIIEEVTSDELGNNNAERNASFPTDTDDAMLE